MISFIIPVYGQWKLTKNCLLSLKKEINIPIEIILIDNGANVLQDDETGVEAPVLGKELFQENFIYLPQEKNINFAAACNLGARTASKELIFFLNNDTEVLPNFLPPLLEAMSKDNSMKMLGSLLLYPPRNNEGEGEKGYTIQHIGIYFNPYYQANHLYSNFPANHRVIKRQRPLQCITGAAMLIYKKDFLHFNGFDEDFINGFEDIEFCGRFIKGGGKLEVIADSKIVHLCSQSVGRKDGEQHNIKLLEKKNVISYFTPDQHTLLKIDGYELRLNEFIKFVPCLNEKLKQSLTKVIQENNLEKIKAQYAKEPYWHEGLKAIISHKDLSLEEKWEFLNKANYIFLESSLVLDYIKISMKLGYLKKEDAKNILLSHFGENINSPEEYSKYRLEKLQKSLHHMKNCSYELYQDTLSHIENHEIFMNTAYQEVFKLNMSLN